MSEKNITGCGTALVTPFAGDAVDTVALRRLVESQIAGGVDFLVPCGTTGESPTLTDDERVEVITTVVEAAAGRVPVVAGTGTNDTAHSVAMTKAARQAGADACLAVAPYYNKPTQEGLYRHFRAMIDDGGLPAMLYHIRGRTGIDIDVATVARVAAGGGVIGLKETESVGRVTALRAACDVPIFSGDDGITWPMIALGAMGVVSVASNVVPAAVSGLVDAALAHDWPGALASHDRLAELFRTLFLEPNPQPVKAALVLRGVIPSAACRLPLIECSAALRAELARVLAPFA
ncbi:MAG: 4-hydroxy-tetrahydrodipicolinate synthase [Planctomycetota bacterium]|nr:4-hydroxy-tetrahydrodipicolinate synthase [Planctomycetota bacterium]